MTYPDFESVQPPWDHQREDFLATRDAPAYMVAWEPRCGKTKLAVDTAGWLRRRGEVDAAVVIAPAGVHLNWSREELAKHWHPAWGEPLVVEWESGRSGQKAQRERLEAALTTDRFVWLVVNVEAVASPKLVNLSARGKPGYLERFVKSRRCLLLVDESQKIKNPRAQRTRAVLKLRDRCPYRRCLSGTPALTGPFDLWAQYHLLDPAVLSPRFTTFKARYGVFRRARYGDRSFDELVGYKNLPELRDRVAPLTTWRKKVECLDLPPRLFTRRRFELPPEHRRVYEQLRDDLLAELANGVVLTAPLAITRLLRLHQVTRGSVMVDDREVELPPPYPAVEATVELCVENPGKTIVWCRFRHDVDQLARALATRLQIVVCDGRTPVAERPDLRRRFREDPAVRVWLGTPGTGGAGVDLGAANLMVWHSHGYDREHRAQGLERNYGSSQAAERVDVVDLVANDTVDEKALAALERSAELAERLTPQRLRELLL